MQSEERGRSAASASPVRALARGLEILNLFSAGRELSQTEIAAESGLPMPTVHRLVATLVQYGYLEQSGGSDRALRLGQAFRLAERATRDNGRDRIQVALRELAHRTGETANLATLVGSAVVYLDGVAGSRLLTPEAAVGSRLPAYCTAIGKALLAQLSDDEVLARLGPGPYERLTDYTVASWESLSVQLAEIRRTGLAVSDQEFEVGLSSMAVAVSSADSPILAVNVSLPSTRATPDFLAQVGARLLRLAAQANA